MSGPGAAEPCAAVPLDAVELAAGMERSQIELGVVIGEARKGQVRIGRFMGIESHEDGFGRIDGLQGVHPVGDGDLAGTVFSLAQEVPRGPGIAASWHQAGIAVQIDFVQRIGAGAEQVTLDGVRIGEHDESVGRVGCQHRCIKMMGLAVQVI